MRQPPGSGDIIEIDLIDADPGAFGESGRGAAPVRARRQRPRWLAPTAVASCVAAAAGLFAWQPWDVPPQWRTFDAPAPATATISNQLVPAEPPGLVASVLEPDSVGSNTPTTALGHVFAEPGATYGFRRAAMFEARRADAADAPRAGEPEPGEPLVQGRVASVERFRVRNEIEWGPIGGYGWRAFTTGLSEEESLAFAEAVGVLEGSAALRHDYQLDGMVPLGSVSAFNSAYALRNELTGGHLSAVLSPTMITYALDDEHDLRVASVPAPPDAMQLVDYVFGTGTATTVHGLPAQLIDSREAGPMIVWLEGGRLITVAGLQTDEQLRAIAESVRPVGADEWLNTVNAVLSYYVPMETWPDDSTPINVGSGTTIGNVPWRVEISIGNPTVTCVYFGEAAAPIESTDTTGTGWTTQPLDDAAQAMCTFSTPRVPATREFAGAFPGVTFVVAILPIEEYRLVLRVTSADGTLTEYQPVQLNDVFTGVAVAIDDDATYSLIDPAL